MSRCSLYIVETDGKETWPIIYAFISISSGCGETGVSARPGGEEPAVFKPWSTAQADSDAAQSTAPNNRCLSRARKIPSETVVVLEFHFK